MPTNSPITPDNIKPGMLLCDRYRIERHLAEGGMASIYQAIDESSGLPVAIKVLFSHYSDNAVIRARFLDEGRIQAMLNHPNIVHVYRVITDPVLSFVMEFVDGETMEQFLQRESVLSEIEIIDLILPVMSAVGFAHQKGIIHRDIKPSNVLLKNTSGFLEPKVMDFGVAKVHRNQKLTLAGTTVGTLHYMSPEQIVGASNIDGRADIYSLGCTLYKLCTGEVPFNASSEFALMMAQVESPPTPPRTLRADLSKAMEQVILKALAKEPEKRFQTIREMTEALMNLTTPESLRDTDTRPIPAALLQFAMEADEIAQDQTAQYRLEYLADPSLDPRNADPDSTASLNNNMTHELSHTALKRIDSDRILAALRKEQKLPQEPLKSDPTVPMEKPSEELLRAARLITTGQEIDEDVKETLEVTADSLRTREFTPRPKLSSPRQNIIAVDNPGVDSREITSRRIPASHVEEARRLAKLSSAAENDATVEDSLPSTALRAAIYAEEEERTSKQSPSALRAGYEVQRSEQLHQELPAPAADQPELALPPLPPRRSDSSSQHSVNKPHNIHTIAPSRRSTDQHRNTPHTAASRRWIIIGVAALLFAVLVFLVVLLTR